MKDQKQNKMKTGRPICGRKRKFESEQMLNCDQNVKNIEIKIPMFDLNNDPLHDQFDNLQTREEIVESKNDHQLDCNSGATLEESEIEVKSHIRLSKNKRVYKSHWEDSLETPEEINTPLKTKKKKQTRWSQYKKIYKSHWEDDPNLKEWIQPIIDDPQKVSCRWCNCSIRAHRADLNKHSETIKHKKNFTLLEENDSNKEIMFSISGKHSSKKKKFKTEKVPTPDGSYIILQTEQNTPNYHCEPESGSIFMDYADDDIGEVKSVSFRHSNSDQEISNIASKIGFVLIDEIEKILRSQKNVLKYFKEGGELSLTDSNVRKMAKICIGHLSQKYLVESALELPKLKSPSQFKEKELTSKFRAIEEKLEKTVAEMKDLKMSFDGVSQVLPFTQIDLGEIFNNASSS